MGFFCSSLEDRKNGITVAITLQQVTTLSSSTAYILMEVASSTAQRKRLLFPVISLRFLGLVVLESRVPSISFLGGIFTGWVRQIHSHLANWATWNNREEYFKWRFRCRRVLNLKLPSFSAVPSSNHYAIFVFVDHHSLSLTYLSRSCWKTSRRQYHVQ